MICETADPAGLSPQIRKLMQRTMSPLTGVTRSLGIFLGNRHEPRFVVAGAELTGIHVLQGRAPPSRSMHIGGCGATAREALLPALAEALERYAQLQAGMRPPASTCFASHADLVRTGSKAVAIEHLHYFSLEQEKAPRHPFRRPTEEDSLQWSRGLSLVSGERLYAPDQLLFLGYTPQIDRGEPWIAPAVTTGTAVHVTPLAALRNALLELVQLDCAMGHWYGHQAPVRVIPDGRTRRLKAAIETLVGVSSTAKPEFYLLPNADLRVFTIACLLVDEKGIPASVVGLGTDMRLEEAMYKALSESSGIYQLAKLVLLQELQTHGGRLPTIDTEQIYDLDMNVVYYAQAANAEGLRSRFREGQTATAADLPADPDVPVGPDIAPLIADFASSGKELLYYDLTTADLRDAGFFAIRVWSPDTISLSLPSAPVLGHRRLAAYGGVRHDAGIHPYP